jgi:predicted PurR-regulated permease PerM
VLAAIIVPALLLAPRIADETEEFINDAPDLFAQAQDRVELLIDRYEDRVPEGAREQIDEWVAELGDSVGSIVTSVLARTAGIAFSTLAALLGYLSVPFFVFYAVRDRERAFSWFYSLFPARLRGDVEQIVGLVSHVFGAYLRGQILLGLVIFLITFIGLSLMDVPFALALAFFAGLTELIPIIGPIIGFVPAFIVILATEPDRWWWIVLFYLGVQGAENYILVPRIHSHTVSLHPVFVLLLIAIGGALFGLVGVLLAVPVAAALRDVFVYIYQRLGEAEDLRLGLETAATIDSPDEVRAAVEAEAEKPATGPD